MVDQAASRPQTGHAEATAPYLRVDLREETVTEKAQPGLLLLLCLRRMYHPPPACLPLHPPPPFPCKPPLASCLVTCVSVGIASPRCSP